MLLALPGLLVTACGSSASTAGTTSTTPTAAASVASGAPSTPSSNETEINPAGDIPDNQVFVPYSLPVGHASVDVPEGWARSIGPEGVTFTDKLNSITISEQTAATALSEADVTATVIPELQSAATAVVVEGVSTVSRSSGDAVLLTYQADSAPDQVTGKIVRNAVERYMFWHAGNELILTLSGPVNADNVDPWMRVSDSVTWLT